MRKKTNLIVIHCSDSPHAHHDNIESIRKWHTERGYVGPDGIAGNEDDIGYHFVITKNGDIHPGRHIDDIGSHCYGYNQTSLGICLTGKDEFSQEQKEALKFLCKKLIVQYSLEKKDIVGHYELDKKGKTCPNFDVYAEVAKWDI